MSRSKLTMSPKRNNNKSPCKVCSSTESRFFTVIYDETNLSGWYCNLCSKELREKLIAL